MKHHITLHGVFHLERGGTLHDVEVDVRTWGTHRSSATLVCHALTGTADVDAWWGGLFGSGRTLDPNESYIVSMNVLGGCAGTTGPATTPPGADEPLGPQFPRVTIRDMVHLQRAVLDELGVTHLDLVIGGSMGGMQVLEWAVLYPKRVGAIAPIAVGAAQSAWAIGISETQRHAIVTDPSFHAGRYHPDAPPAAGMTTARMIAMCSYRSHENFESRFARTQANGDYAVQSYLRHQGDKLVTRFDANSYLTLIDAMDSHDLGRDRGPREAIIRRITQPAIVVGITSDVLYPITEVEALAEAMPNARFAAIDSPHGHDAFLMDTAELDTIIRTFLASAARSEPLGSHGSA